MLNSFVEDYINAVYVDVSTSAFFSLFKYMCIKSHYLNI